MNPADGEMRLKAGAQNYHSHGTWLGSLPDTRHMIIFDVLTDSPMGWKVNGPALFSDGGRIPETTEPGKIPAMPKDRRVICTMTAPDQLLSCMQLCGVVVPL